MQQKSATLNRFDLIRSPIFLVLLFLLVVNDLALKPMFHNWFTGKLSDFTGLAAFTMFFCSVWPKRVWLVGLLVSIAFIYWKSEYAQGLISFINGQLPIQIGRTVDFTDLVALPVVWFVCWYAPKFIRWNLDQTKVFVIAIVSLLAFTGTSMVSKHVVRETAGIDSEKTDQAPSRTEADLQKMFDEVAKQHDMHCVECESLSQGRVYRLPTSVRLERQRGNLALTANFDPSRFEVFYAIETSGGPGDPLNVEEVDSLKEELQHILRSKYPNVTIDDAERLRHSRVRIWVSKKDGGSYSDKANQNDFRKAKAIVREIALREGLHEYSYAGPQKYSDGSEIGATFYKGRLYGPYVYDREMIVSVSIADSPLVSAQILASPRYLDLQSRLAAQIEMTFKETFGDKRVW